MAADATGNVYVADQGNHRIQKFSATGVYLTQWGSGGTGTELFITPEGVATDATGCVYVADPIYSRIQKFTSTGTYLTQWGSYGYGNGQFRAPEGVATDAAGNVYVTDPLNDRIQKFTGTGTYLTQWGSYGSGNGQFNGPYAVATDATGNVYVTDYPDRIQKFGPPAVDVRLPEAGDNVVGLTRIWPNPIRTEFTVSLKLASEAGAVVEVLDLAGRSVLRHEIGRLGPGTHAVRFTEGASLPAGVYLVRLTQARKTVSKAIVVLR